uniref:Uncharacterized protein n=1 Tax=Globisporangium ultimum (strain ATCC 200006 / CBS 805.95 / DAOM BR144) TaxID=431595 RepID=K3W7W5_GLOUD
MLLALDKLMLCVKKYYRALVQLFSTSLVGTSQRGQCGSAERMTKDEFMEFLRQMQVFPQLFHRREVEKAFDAACCSSSDQKDINLPEFIEAIIRCSSNLQWGDGAASSDKGESGITVRFLMLLFAMEGKGTILQKRNEDLQVVLGRSKLKRKR